MCPADSLFQLEKSGVNWNPRESVISLDRSAARPISITRRWARLARSRACEQILIDSKISDALQGKPTECAPSRLIGYVDSIESMPFSLQV